MLRNRNIYSSDSGQIRYIDRFENVNVGRPHFSAEGRWLSIQTFEDLGKGGSDPWGLNIYALVQRSAAQIFKDLERRREVETHPAADWSEDSRWLIRAFDGYLILTDTSVLVGDGFFLNRIIIPPAPICDIVA